MFQMFSVGINRYVNIALFDDRSLETKCTDIVNGFAFKYF